MMYATNEVEFSDCFTMAIKKAGVIARASAVWSNNTEFNAVYKCVDCKNRKIKINFSVERSPGNKAKIEVEFDGRVESVQINFDGTQNQIIGNMTEALRKILA